eukprot:GAFH01005325.1.p1 GENE.GAFH01005325.1~~GAFH01005325.1.p1  ORF type:complete len:122 (-),score=1.30 GAFH01005325.1:187-552(-)
MHEEFAVNPRTLQPSIVTEKPNHVNPRNLVVPNPEATAQAEALLATATRSKAAPQCPLVPLTSSQEYGMFARPLHEMDRRFAHPLVSSPESRYFDVVARHLQPGEHLFNGGDKGASTKKKS